MTQRHYLLLLYLPSLTWLIEKALSRLVGPAMCERPNGSQGNPFLTQLEGSKEERGSERWAEQHRTGRGNDTLAPPDEVGSSKSRACRRWLRSSLWPDYWKGASSLQGDPAWTEFKNISDGKLLVVQCLGPHTSTAVDPVLIPGQGNKVLQTVRCSKKKRKEKKNQQG